MIEVKEVHLLKAPFPIEVNEFGSVIDVKEVQPWKVFTPIEVTEVNDISIEISLLLSLNALEIKLSDLLGKTISICIAPSEDNPVISFPFQVNQSSGDS